MISTRLAKAEDIQFYAPHPGRLLHVRIPHGSTHVDILNWYQYAINQHDDGTPDRRQKLLMQIQKTIAHLPRRNILLLGGDFNCPCEPHGSVCGTAVVPHNPLYYPDSRIINMSGARYISRRLTHGPDLNMDNWPLSSSGRLMNSPTHRSTL